MLDIKEYKESKRVFDFFEEISAIPRGSTNTVPIADYLENFAKSRSLWYYRDKADNVIIRKAATLGYESRPTIIFQGHTDIVADKASGCIKDLENEGLDIYRDGDFIRARGTTLGADDGVAIAYALAVLDSDDIEHPEFEALFTSDEEIGLLGADALDTKHLKGRLLVNIDSDDEGVFTVGCAGGLRTDTVIMTEREKCNSDFWKITVSGLKGGHSGVEIDKGRTNAVKLLCELLLNLDGLQISSISGGNADNAIPRYAECVFALNETEAKRIPSLIDAFVKKHSKTEENIKISFEKQDTPHTVLKNPFTSRVLEFISAVPSGVVKMSTEIPGQVETSANLGVVSTTDTSVEIAVSVRSSKNEEKRRLVEGIEALANKISADFTKRGAYPAWEYRENSYLRDVMVKVYTEMYQKQPSVITIHAGLECGILCNKTEGLDCVSIGPDNFDIHTPEEHLSISSTIRVWEYLKRLLKSI